MGEYLLNEEEENKIILREYRSLLRSLKSIMKRGDKTRLRNAFEMAVEAHRDMRRKSGEPYILHPLAVAKIVVDEISLGVTSVICALLHDVVEDTELTLEDINEEFGETVTKIIDGLTKIAFVVDSNNETSMQAENFKKILIALAEDPRVILIKLADRLHNMRTLESMVHDKQLKICSETTYIYAPLAHRLGLYEIKTELEDLALKYTQPENYNLIAKNLKETKRERTRYINEFIKPIKDMLTNAGFNFEIFGRPKSINSIWNKIRTKHVSFDEVYDLFAIRIVLDSEYVKEKEDCWKVYSLITSIYRPNTERMRDWLSVPKGNGYEALHTTVMGPGGKWVEIQIKSQRMNAIAEKGLAAHWKYKEGSPRPQESKLDSWLQGIRDVINNNKNTDTLEFMQDFKLDLFSEEIYIYTPKGEMRVLPKGATALDFAFDVHSELGAHCLGAKVNYKLVSINHKLKSGDQVEIISSKKQRPNEDWLSFVVTAKAKSRIKYYLKEQKRQIADLGKEILERKLKHLGVHLNNQNALDLSNYFKKTSPFDLYYAIAIGNIDLTELKDFQILGDKIIPPIKSKDLSIENDIGNDATLKKNTKGTELIIFGESSDKVLYKLANCCQPIPGDDVFGFITAGEGLKIHRTDCPNASRLLSHYGHRVVKTKWAKNKEISFLSGVKITGLDDVGVIKKITNIITDTLNMNMRSISLESSEGIFEGTIMVYVHDKEEFDDLCNHLVSLDGIYTIERLQNIDSN